MKNNRILLENVNLHYSSVAFKERSLKSLLGNLLKRPVRGSGIHDVHALKNLSLEIRSGERVGLIGHNGAGKSTLLKTIAGLYPTSGGRLLVEGTVRSLFDLSLGFEPDATGRENILYRGLLLGLSPQFMREKEEEIVDFAGLGEFIDYPIKTYSAGMQVRLAFAISTAVGGDVLLLDEVIGAGDASFMAKAQQRIKQLIDQSEILILASHDFSALTSICDRGIVLHHGEVIFDGQINEALMAYKRANGLHADEPSSPPEVVAKEIAIAEAQPDLVPTEYRQNFERLDGEMRRVKEWTKDIASYMMRSHWRLVDKLERMDHEPENLSCALCSSIHPLEKFAVKESRCIFHGGRLRRYVCPSCGVTFGPLKMFDLDETMVDLEYRNLYRVYSEGDTTEYEKRSFFNLQPEKAGRYLNFGCGGEWSKSIQQLRDEGWDIIGFEPSAQNPTSNILRSWDELEKHRFDGIFSHNVLEHLFDPCGTLRRLSGLLKPEGGQVHSTACFEYKFEFTRFHVFFYTGNAMRYLAEKANMTIDEWEKDGDYIACMMSAIN
jgi:lipopolysaccharide transport system ATP-binding protein